LKIAIGSDHRGAALKRHLIGILSGAGHEMIDCGGTGDDPVDYPDSAFVVGRLVAAGECERGILICGTGIGVSIAANKVRGVRAALCWNVEMAEITRRHNDSNVLCLSGDATGLHLAGEMARRWLATDFEGGRHAGRVNKIVAYEES